MARWLGWAAGILSWGGTSATALAMRLAPPQTPHRAPPLRGAALTVILWLPLRRLGDADHAAGQAAAGVAGGLRLQVVGLGVHDDGAADHAMVAVKGEL